MLIETSKSETMDERGDCYKQITMEVCFAFSLLLFIYTFISLCILSSLEFSAQAEKYHW